MSEFDPRAILEVLRRHEVEFVVIGALAAIAQGAPIPPTADVDVTPDRSPANLQRLCDALRALESELRGPGVPDGLRFDCDAASLARMQDFVNLTCAFGDFDLCFTPGGFPGGFTELDLNAVVADIEGLEVRVASLDDIITSKQAAGRPKDLPVLRVLVAHRDRGDRE